MSKSPIEPGEITKTASNIIKKKYDLKITSGGLDKLDISPGMNAHIIAELYYIKIKKGGLSSKNFEKNFDDEFFSNLYNSMRGGKPNNEKLQEVLKKELILELYTYAYKLGMLD